MADIYSDGAFGSNSGEFTVVGATNAEPGKLYFTAQKDASRRRDIWTMTGTPDAPGTAVQITNPAVLGADPPRRLFAVNGTLYFRTGSGHDAPLWWLDPETGDPIPPDATPAVAVVEVPGKLIFIERAPGWNYVDD